MLLSTIPSSNLEHGPVVHVPWCAMMSHDHTDHQRNESLKSKGFHLFHWPQNHGKYLSAHPTTATGFFAAQDKISSADAPRPGRRRLWNNQQNSGNCFVPGRMPKDSPHRFQTPSPKLQKSNCSPVLFQSTDMPSRCFPRHRVSLCTGLVDGKS